MPSIEATVTNQQITATAGESQIDVAVSGGFGPTGSQGPSGTVAVSAPLLNSGTSSAAQISLIVGDGLRLSGNSLALASHQHVATDIQGLGTAASRNVPSSGNAGASQVVLGGDSRLTDQRTPLDLSVTASKIQSGAVSGVHINNSSPFTFASVSSPGLISAAGGLSVVFGGVTNFLVGSSGFVTTGRWRAQAVEVSHGGTGATTAAAALANLGAAAASHTHSLSDIAQSGATLNQVAAWNGAAWAPATVTSGSSAWGDITGKPATFPPSSHTHSADDITSGTLNADRLPGTVVLTSDARLSDQRVPTNLSVTAAKIAAGAVNNTHINTAVPFTFLSVNALNGVEGQSVSAVGGPIASYNSQGALQFRISSSGVVDAGVWQGSAISVAYGGTGATTASAARANIGAAAENHTHAASAITDFASAVAAASPEEVIEATTVAGFPATGNTSALYVATDASRFYRWTGSVYVEVGPVATYPATHTHTASQITGGAANTFLRGDGTWATVGPQLVLAAHTQANSINANANTNLRYTTATTDADAAYSTSTGKYTVPAGKGGLYAAYIGFVADGGTKGSTVVDIKIFGTTLGEVSVNGSATYATIDGTLRFAGMVFVALTAGEEVNVRTYATAALTPNNASETFNAFKLFKL